ncbi:hypothetical protein [Aestuariivita sp.]|jgi:hypothetical protein|uniref:hypothetical protein n=1 Tax=Aestuariivita sp. TaxID=1872407 RepID=UPI00216C4942|nr:hypothetical protein [Aestuariivita sp.]MCE8007777.1 hypothetical protein [Aestuariivita sp.]
MSDPDEYIALVSSLPSSERLFVAKQPPLSRLRLDRRLAALSAEHSLMLAQIEALLSWSAYDMQADEAVAIRRAKAALRDIAQPTLRAIVQDRMELRTAVAALRLRARGDGPPPGAWGLGRWTRHIAANWSEPTFRLDRSMPWLREAARMIEHRDPLELQRHLLDVSFRRLQRHAARHQFDFEAVVIYVLKWNIFDRWAQANAEAAARRFSELSLEALRDFPDLMLEGQAP